jgi:type IX secretion system PorP/SprF family membrane protein
MIKKLITFAVLSWFFFFASGQDEFSRLSSLSNPWILNPALTGTEGNSMNFYANKQWLGFKGAPSSFGFHINGRLAPFGFYTHKMHLNRTNYKSMGRVGLGAAVFTDNSGPFSFTELKLNYAYNVPFNRNQLSFSLSNDFEIWSVREGEMNPLVPSDPAIKGITRGRLVYNPGFGVYYYNTVMGLGLSVNRLLKNEVVLKVTDDLRVYSDDRLFSLQGRYLFLPKSDFSYEASFAVASHEFNDLLYDISLTLNYKENIHLTGTYRSLNCFLAQFAVESGRYLFRYGLSYPFGKLSSYIYGTHEISLGIIFSSYLY